MLLLASERAEPRCPTLRPHRGPSWRATAAVVFADPSDNHDLNLTAYGFVLKRGNLAMVWIDYRSADHCLEMFLSYATNAKPTRLVLSIAMDLSPYLVGHVSVPAVVCFLCLHHACGHALAASAVVSPSCARVPARTHARSCLSRRCRGALPCRTQSPVRPYVCSSALDRVKDERDHGVRNKSF